MALSGQLGLPECWLRKEALNHSNALGMVGLASSRSYIKRVWRVSLPT